MNAIEAIRILQLMPKQGDAIKCAIEALEKQVAKKPIIPKQFADLRIGFCECGDGVNEEMRYCCSCGQRIDWSEENENGWN